MYAFCHSSSPIQMPLRISLLLLPALVHTGILAQTQSVLPESLSKAPDSVKTWSLREMGDSLVRAGQLAPAKLAYQEALRRSLGTGNPTDIGISYRGVGYWYQQVNEYQRAIDHYQQALGYLRQRNDPKQVSRTMQSISSAYSQLNDLKNARVYLEQAMPVARQSKKPELEIELIGELAIIEAKSNRHQQALVLNQRVVDFYRARNDSSAYYSALFNLAIEYKNAGQYKRAEQTFRDILAFAQRTGDSYLSGYAYANLPNALIPQGKLDEATAYSKRAIAWSEQTGAEKFNIREEAYGILSRVEQQRGNYRQALLYYQQQMAAHDSVYNAIKNRQLVEMETRFQTQEKEAQIQALATINQQKTRQVWAGVGGIAVLSALLGTLFLLYRSGQHKQVKIQQQSDQLTVLMRELHHRVKNNLAIVASLLRLQSNRLDDEKAVAAVRVGQQRVEAMSLIHQRLYQTDNVSSVNMREFLTDLSESLMQAYGYSTDEFDLQLDIDQDSLDVDVAMPLGLIVNELITNAFKYAYANVPQPLLRIALYQSAAKGPGVTLEVQDNGPGLDAADWQRAGQKTSFGRRLIQSLSEQLDGELSVIRQNGTLFRLHIPQHKLRAAA